MEGVKRIRKKGEGIKLRKGIRNEGLKDHENSEKLFFTV
jgi:hypothetical protein